MQELAYADIGMRIRQSRKEKGWSQEELAIKCGVSLSFIGQMERGTRHMSLDTFARLCQELEVSADILLWGYPKSLEADIRTAWDTAEKKQDNSYAMYIRIMKSVADILSRGDGKSGSSYEDPTAV